MVPSIANGLSLSRSLKHHNMTTVYGPNTLKILQAIGYSTVSNTKMNKITLSTTFGTESYDPSDAKKEGKAN